MDLTSTVCLAHRIDIAGGQSHSPGVFTVNENGLPTSAWVCASVIPSHAGTVAPVCGWSIYDSFYGQYVFVTTYTAGMYEGRVRVKFLIDNTPAEDSVLYYSYDQNLPCNYVKVELMTDNYPGETSWDLIDEATGGIVATGTPSSPNTLYVECVDEPGCYSFIIYDSYCDGICCAYGNGFYKIYYEGALVASGGSFGCSETATDIGDCAECGNNSRERNEECDGTDDAACPGLCLPDCTCADPSCGDKIVNQIHEDCDGTDDAACPGECQVDCSCPPICGDDQVNQAQEECDGADDLKCSGYCRADCTCPPNCDFDGDGDSDLYDYSLFQVCFASDPATSGCSAEDLNGDGAVNLDDFNDCFSVFTGPDSPCPCDRDVNDDGVIDSLDNDATAACIDLPASGSCRGADVDCDGDVDTFDWLVVLGLEQCPVP